MRLTPGQSIIPPKCLTAQPLITKEAGDIESVCDVMLVCGTEW